MLIVAGQYLFPNGVYVQASKFIIYAFCGLKIPFTAIFLLKNLVAFLINSSKVVSEFIFIVIYLHLNEVKNLII